METEAINQLAQFVAAGGDVGVWVVAFLMFKFDKRLSAVEWHTGVRHGPKT